MASDVSGPLRYVPLNLPPSPLVRLRTFVDSVESDEERLHARLDAVFANGRSVVLLDDRGWGGGGGWKGYFTAKEIERTACVVVGPDGPYGDITEAEDESNYWEYLARILQKKGIDASAAELRTLPQDVDLSRRVLAQLRDFPLDDDVP